MYSIARKVAWVQAVTLWRTEGRRRNQVPPQALEVDHRSEESGPSVGVGIFVALSQHRSPWAGVASAVRYVLGAQATQALASSSTLAGEVQGGGGPGRVIAGAVRVAGERSMWSEGPGSPFAS